MAPEDMVQLLNEIFMKFDSLVERYSLEKIRTIGDNTMVAAGVPTPHTDHSEAMANLALDVETTIKNRPSNGNNKLSFRMGINSGPVIAGVIGKQKFHYDVWGDTVNTAIRMESHGAAGKIQITKATHELIKDDLSNPFTLTPANSDAVYAGRKNSTAWANSCCLWPRNALKSRVLLQRQSPAKGTSGRISRAQPKKLAQR